MKQLTRQILALMVGALAFSTLAVADEVYARIRGTVTDATAAVVQGAQVTASSIRIPASPKLWSSDPDGSFQFLQLPVGNYDVIITASGFRKFQAGTSSWY